MGSFNNFMGIKENDLKIIYEDVAELHRQQQSAIELVYNKLNWILVSDIVFIAAIMSGRHPNIAVLLLICLSAILALLGLEPQSFKMTQKITDQLANAGKEDFLEDLIKKKKEVYNKNESRSTTLNLILTGSKMLLIIGITLQFMAFLLPRW